MRKYLVVTIAALVLGATVSTTTFAIASDGDPAPAASDSVRRLGDEFDKLPKLSENINCGSVNCFNKTLRRHARHINDIEDILYGCILFLPVDYDGGNYLFRDFISPSYELLFNTC